MKRICLFIGFFLFTTIGYGQEAVLVHVNAEFNKSNDWYALDQLNKARVFSGYIDENPKIKDKYNISKVPTLILFYDGKEVKRWEGGLDMKLNVNPKEVQWAIDRL